MVINHHLGELADLNERVKSEDIQTDTLPPSKLDESLAAGNEELVTGTNFILRSVRSQGIALAYPVRSCTHLSMKKSQIIRGVPAVKYVLTLLRFSSSCLLRSISCYNLTFTIAEL